MTDTTAQLAEQEAIDQAQEDGVSPEQVRAELEADGLEGQVPGDMEVATLHRYIRAKNRLADECERVKEQFAKVLASLATKEKHLDYVFGPSCSDTTSRLISTTKKKSYACPWGTAGFRAVKANVVVEDKDQLVAALLEVQKANPDDPLVQALVMKPDVVKAKLNEYVFGTGDCPPGTSIAPEHDKFYVK